MRNLFKWVGSLTSVILVKRCRGEVEVVGALITTVIVVGGFAVLWIWLYPRYMDWEKNVRDAVQAAKAASREKLVLELAACREGRVSVVVTCTGEIGLRVASVYLNESLVWSGSLYLAPGGTATIDTMGRCGQVLRLKVCSSRGNCWSFLEEAP